MLTISHAVLHVFDLESGGFYPSERELDISERTTKSYVQRHLRRAAASAEASHGRFSAGSTFLGELNSYLSGAVTFLDFSTTVARFLYDELRKSDDECQYDLLVADFDDSVDTSDTEEGDNSRAVKASFEGVTERGFAMLLLPRRRTFMHVTDEEGGERVNEVVRHDSQLPNPTQKVDTYAVVDVASSDVTFHDKERVVAGEQALIIPDGLLSCTKEASTREVVEAVSQLAERVAEEAGELPTVALASAKAAVARCVERSEELSCSEVADVVFEGKPDQRRSFEAAAAEEDIPASIPVRKGVANRLTRNHRIKTDTGIEVTFPSDYADKPEFIEFVTGADGRVSIEIRNVASIEDK
ncbi:MAG: nucleoid-associated protein [Atopobiaceae bacterium]|jgi:hypothetical protein|nr:nucleoid-associated protein [Atopobiaceae bacterium]MCI2172829.1 nucleoid-associated protein [Atopobiaceae bacterium]MCI2207136.1 nucleoid-associated protein [Atopobiaceae bacterium]